MSKYGATTSPKPSPRSRAPPARSQLDSASRAPARSAISQHACRPASRRMPACSTWRPNRGASRPPARPAPTATPNENGISVRPAWIAVNAAPELQVQRERQQHAHHPGEEQRRANAEPAGERAPREQRRHDQRVGAGAPRAGAREREQRRAARRSRAIDDVGPRRPARARGPGSAGTSAARRRPVTSAMPTEVEPRRDRRARLRAGRGRRRRSASEPEREVDEEDHPPARAEQVAVDQRAADDRPAAPRPCP